MQVRVLYTFEAQPGSGELTIRENEILTVSRQDVGDGWWEGTNSRGQSGLFPAGYVEMVSSAPPAPTLPQIPMQPMQPTPIQTSPQVQTPPQQWDVMDADWGEDDWDDDDSQTSNTDTYNYNSGQSLAQQYNNNTNNTQSSLMPSSSGPPRQQPQQSVRKSFNRFSTFVKSGGEDYILGIKTLNVSEDCYIYIIESDGQYMWSPNQNPYSVSVEKPKKESKMKGLKSYIAYQLTPSHTNIQVSRRYKHFDWLCERLQDKFTTIPIPALPDKQISGRYQEEFIEHRRTQLQSWVNRICRHPILSQCDVWMHFITCSADEKRWKAGKRKAEKDELVGASLFFSVQPPSNSTPLDISSVDRKMDSFSRFIYKMDDSVKYLSATAQDQMKKYGGPYKREFNKLANSFKHLSASFELSGIRSRNNDELNSALKHTSETYDAIGKMYEEQPRYDFGPMSDMLHEYKGILTAWPEILQVHKGALNKKREHQKLLDEGKIDEKSVQAINQRADVVTYGTLAEMNHFETERIEDFNILMQNFLTQQVTFYQNIVYKLQETLNMYNKS